VRKVLQQSLQYPETTSCLSSYILCRSSTFHPCVWSSCCPKWNRWLNWGSRRSIHSIELRVVPYRSLMCSMNQSSVPGHPEE